MMPPALVQPCWYSEEYLNRVPGSAGARRAADELTLVTRGSLTSTGDSWRLGSTAILQFRFFLPGFGLVSRFQTKTAGTVAARGWPQSRWGKCAAGGRLRTCKESNEVTSSLTSHRGRAHTFRSQAAPIAWVSRSGRSVPTWTSGYYHALHPVSADSGLFLLLVPTATTRPSRPRSHGAPSAAACPVTAVRLKRH